MGDYKRGDPIPFLNDGAVLFPRTPARRTEKSADPRVRLAVLQKACAELKRKHQRTLSQFSTAAVKSGHADALETLETQIAETESEIAAVQASIDGFGEYFDGHVATTKSQHDLRVEAQRQDAGWDYLLTRRAPAQPAQKAFNGPRGQYDESKHPRNPKGSGRNAGKFAPKGGGGAPNGKMKIYGSGWGGEGGTEYPYIMKNGKRHFDFVPREGGVLADMDNEEKAQMLQGGFSDAVRDSAAFKAYAGEGMHGFVHNAVRTPAIDRAVEKHLRGKGLSAQQIGKWLTTAPGRHMMDWLDGQTVGSAEFKRRLAVGMKNPLKDIRGM